jgi:hypothetical protein
MLRRLTRTTSFLSRQTTALPVSKFQFRSNTSKSSRNTRQSPSSPPPNPTPRSFLDIHNNVILPLSLIFALSGTIAHDFYQADFQRLKDCWRDAYTPGIGPEGGFLVKCRYVSDRRTKEQEEKEGLIRRGGRGRQDDGRLC